jgi:hypothetical protein
MVGDITGPDSGLVMREVELATEQPFCRESLEYPATESHTCTRVTRGANRRFVTSAAEQAGPYVCELNHCRSCDISVRAFFHS